MSSLRVLRWCLIFVNDIQSMSFVAVLRQLLQRTTRADVLTNDLLHVYRAAITKVEGLDREIRIFNFNVVECLRMKLRTRSHTYTGNAIVRPGLEPSSIIVKQITERHGREVFRTRPVHRDAKVLGHLINYRFARRSSIASDDKATKCSSLPLYPGSLGDILLGPPRECIRNGYQAEFPRPTSITPKRIASPNMQGAKHLRTEDSEHPAIQLTEWQTSMLAEARAREFAINLVPGARPSTLKLG